ncbi:MAG: TIGR03619 family F420-dependent LLM class oxidoreductase [Cellvibrionales bacterium]|jgi:probable F420-dependent oxidoreductase|nr:TIGR03619 family F420-dependent LLM class oxidoreductase [Cellvibrionales bacterium]MBK8676478.1 TIGR03619 family F420-dependent LLM class oxidoreductase [Cellvibrionales bacterium]HRF87875.1 TIGR03619 family F420-dependent LLM class oxidoreductase [Pseudomonadales bacterium]HRG50746.1 TIGR03619 family F420-dependent LLM class oxidoreductase [Pseudomonadales bacterium]
MKFWQSLAFCELDQVVELAKFSEELGFYGVSFGDHLITTKTQVDEYLYTQNGQVFWHPETHWPDPWVIAAAIAQQTKNLQFLTTIYVLPMRDSFNAAKAISTAAYLSNNRIIMGVGIGWQKTEFDLTGHDFHTRGKRTDEQLEVMAKLMSGAMVEHHGAFHDFAPLQMSPGTTKPVPVFIGGDSDAAFRRAAQHDGWLGLRYTEEQLPAVLQKVQAAREEAGTQSKPFDVWTAVLQPQDGTFKRVEAMGVTMTNGANFMVDGKIVPSDIDFKKKRIEAFAKQFIHVS